MDKVVLHTLSAHFPPHVTFSGVKPLIAAGLFDIETCEFRFFTPENAKVIPEIITNASLLITYNGEENAFPILRKHYGLKGRTSNIPQGGKHIEILKEIKKTGARSAIKFEEAVRENLSEERFFPQGKLPKLTSSELYEACRSDVGQIHRLYQLYLKKELQCPKGKPRAKSKSLAQLEKEALLTIELVPSTSWFTNVRSQVSTKDWDVIRKETYKKAQDKCQICSGVGSRHPVECHEIWEYVDFERTQRLLSFIALCPRCHEVKHLGMANMRGRGDAAIQHLAEVNHWSAGEARRYVKNAFDKWIDRSMFDWNLDLQLLNKMAISYAKT
jgi:hypothetical protein